MITVNVRYHNMLRHRAGIVQESVDLPDGSNLYRVLGQLADHHGTMMREMLFAPDGRIAPHLVVFCNGRLVDRNQRADPLADGDVLMLFPAISGG
jgi:MoaD family protein